MGQVVLMVEVVERLRRFRRGQGQVRFVLELLGMGLTDCWCRIKTRIETKKKTRKGSERYSNSQ